MGGHFLGGEKSEKQERDLFYGFSNYFLIWINAAHFEHFFPTILISTKPSFHGPHHLNALTKIHNTTLPKAYPNIDFEDAR